MELEGRPLMLKEWLELESNAELSRHGFVCYPRHLLAELRSGSGRRRNGDVVAKVSAAVRAALFRPMGREGEAALFRSFSRRLRVGFWKRRRGEREEVDRRVASCSAATSSGRRDGSSLAMSPRRRSWEEGGQAGGVGGRQRHETEVLACPLNEEREQEQRLSPVSVMDFLSQDEDDGEDADGNGGSEDDEVSSPTFQQSLANMRRASQQLLQKIRRFEQLAELDASEVDDATTATEDVNCHVAESHSAGEEGDEGAPEQGLLDLLEASTVGPTCCFQKLLLDFFGDGGSSCHGDRFDGLDRATVLMKTAKAWLDGQGCSLRSEGKAELSEEIERVGRWRCFRDDEQELLAVDLEGDILWSLVGEFVGELR